MNQIKKTHSVLVLNSIVLAAFLTACGGGSSSGGSTSPTDPVVKTCSNGANDYPTCKFFPADLQLTVPTPPFPEGSDDMIAFNFLNNERSLGGLGKLAYSPELTKAAAAHANYYFLNQSKSSLDPHNEVTTYPGFTGITPLDRAKVAGYSVGASGAASEGTGQVNSKLGLIKNLINSLYHRSTIFNQSWREVGFATQCVDANCVGENGYFGVATYGYKTKQRNDTNFVFVYPRDGQTSVRPIYCGEFPWPFADFAFGKVCEISTTPTQEILYSKGAGFPISVSVNDNNVISLDSFQVFEQGSSTPIESWILTSQNDINKAIPKNEAYLITKTAMKLNAIYNVRVSGKSNDTPFTRNWSFTTDRVQVQ